jgi:HAD superfamily hydrolase (TIGR01549 family)
MARGALATLSHMRPKAIFFDVGGTLIFPDLTEMMAPLLRRGVHPTAEQLFIAEKAAKHIHTRDADDAPGNRSHWYVYFSSLLEQIGAGRDLLEELAARAGNSSYWTVQAPRAKETLERLQRDYRLAVISNADGKIRQVLESVGLAQYFESITDSGLVGHEKPDRRIFEAALSSMQLSAEDGLYVGDIYAVDYAGATAAGMKAVVIDFPRVYRGNSFPRVESLDELVDYVQRIG